MEIFSTFHARIKYISGENTSFRLLCYNLASRNSLLLRATKPKHRTDTVYIFVRLLKPLFDFEPDYVVRKPRKWRFQWCIVHTEIFLTFHARVKYISVKTVIRFTDTVQQWCHSLFIDCSQRDGRKDGKSSIIWSLPVSLRSLGRYNKPHATNSSTDRCYTQ